MAKVKKTFKGATLKVSPEIKYTGSDQSTFEGSMGELNTTLGPNMELEYDSNIDANLNLRDDLKENFSISKDDLLNVPTSFLDIDEYNYTKNINKIDNTEEKFNPDLDKYGHLTTYLEPRPNPINFEKHSFLNLKEMQNKVKLLNYFNSLTKDGHKFGGNTEDGKEIIYRYKYGEKDNEVNEYTYSDLTNITDLKASKKEKGSKAKALDSLLEEFKIAYREKQRDKDFELGQQVQNLAKNDKTVYVKDLKNEIKHNPERVNNLKNFYTVDEEHHSPQYNRLKKLREKKRMQNIHFANNTKPQLPDLGNFATHGISQNMFKPEYLELKDAYDIYENNYINDIVEYGTYLSDYQGNQMMLDDYYKTHTEDELLKKPVSKRNQIIDKLIRSNKPEDQIKLLKINLDMTVDTRKLDAINPENNNKINVYTADFDGREKDFTLQELTNLENIKSNPETFSALKQCNTEYYSAYNDKLALEKQRNVNILNDIKQYRRLDHTLPLPDHIAYDPGKQIIVMHNYGETSLNNAIEKKIMSNPDIREEDKEIYIESDKSMTYTKDPYDMSIDEMNDLLKQQARKGTVKKDMTKDIDTPQF